MGWTVPQVRDLESDDFNALCDWAERRNEDRESDSVDVDKLMEARRAAKDRGDD